MRTRLSHPHQQREQARHVVAPTPRALPRLRRRLFVCARPVHAYERVD